MAAMSCQVHARCRQSREAIRTRAVACTWSHSHLSIPEFGRDKQEDREFEIILDCVASSRSARGTGNPISENI